MSRNDLILINANTIRQCEHDFQGQLVIVMYLLIVGSKFLCIMYTHLNGVANVTFIFKDSGQGLSATGINFRIEGTGTGMYETCFTDDYSSYRLSQVCPVL